MKTTQIEIPFSRKKLTRHLFTSIIFLIIGCWIIVYNPQTSNRFFNNPVFKNTAAVLSILSGLLGTFFFGKRLIDKRPGFIVNDTSFTDHTSAVSAGEVLWCDVANIITTKVFSRHFIIVILKDPEKYISRQQNAFKRKTMQLNLKNYNSPVHITADGLKTTFKDLEDLLRRSFEAYRQNALPLSG